VRSFAYAYNLTGMITQKLDMTSGSCITNVYTYDGLNRLLSESIMQSGNEVIRQFSYDIAGNRLSETCDGTTNTGGVTYCL